LEQKSFAAEREKNKSSLSKENEVKNKLKVGLFVSLVVIILILGGLGYLALKRKKVKNN